MGHKNVAQRFDRYKLTHGYNTYVNQRQFQSENATFPDEFRYPDVTYSDELKLHVGIIPMLCTSTSCIEYFRNNALWLKERTTIITFLLCCSLKFISYWDWVYVREFDPASSIVMSFLFTFPPNPNIRPPSFPSFVRRKQVFSLYRETTIAFQNIARIWVIVCIWP